MKRWLESFQTPSSCEDKTTAVRNLKLRVCLVLAKLQSHNSSGANGPHIMGSTNTLQNSQTLSSLMTCYPSFLTCWHDCIGSFATTHRNCMESVHSSGQDSRRP